MIGASGEKHDRSLPRAVAALPAGVWTLRRSPWVVRWRGYRDLATGVTSDLAVTPIRRQFRAQSAPSTTRRGIGRSIATGGDGAGHDSSGAHTPPRYHRYDGRARGRRRLTLRPRAGGKVDVRALVRDDRRKCREARSIDIMIGYDIYGGFLDTETVAVTRAVTWVPRSCHGSDLRPSRDADTSPVSRSKCPIDDPQRHRSVDRDGR